MKSAADMKIQPDLQKALHKFESRVKSIYPIDSMVLFGSTARGEHDNESDQDILILTQNKLSREERHEITDIAFEINLEFDTNISTTVLDSTSWNNGPYTMIPFRSEIEHDGIVL